MQSVPNIPGIPVRDDRALKDKVAQLLDMKKYKCVRSLKSSMACIDWIYTIVCVDSQVLNLSALDQSS